MKLLIEVETTDRQNVVDASNLLISLLTPALGKSPAKAAGKKAPQVEVEEEEEEPNFEEAEETEEEENYEEPEEEEEVVQKKPTTKTISKEELLAAFKATHAKIQASHEKKKMPKDKAKAKTMATLNAILKKHGAISVTKLDAKKHGLVMKELKALVA